MTDNIAPTERKALALFNFMSMKRQNDKRIGDLTLGNFVEMCKFLTEIEEPTTIIDTSRQEKTGAENQ